MKLDLMSVAARSKRLSAGNPGINSIVLTRLEVVSKPLFVRLRGSVLSRSETVMKVEPSDAQWARMARLLPKPKAKPKGGRPCADDRAVMEGILWVLCSGARWRDMPDRYPAYATRWRRLGEWERAELLLSIWRAFLKHLDEAQQLDWSEAFMDGTFAPANKGAIASAKHASQRAEETLAHGAVPRVGAGRPKQNPQRIIADRGYDSHALWARPKCRGIS